MVWAVESSHTNCAEFSRGHPLDEKSDAMASFFIVNAPTRSGSRRLYNKPDIACDDGIKASGVIFVCDFRTPRPLNSFGGFLYPRGGRMMRFFKILFHVFSIAALLPTALSANLSCTVNQQAMRDCFKQCAFAESTCTTNPGQPAPQFAATAMPNNMSHAEVQAAMAQALQEHAAMNIRPAWLANFVPNTNSSATEGFFPWDHGSWAWHGSGTGIGPVGSVGRVDGIAMCSETEGSSGVGGSPSSTLGPNCWCRMEHPFRGPWVSSTNGLPDCPGSCIAVCSANRSSPDFRNAIFAN